MMTSLAGLLLCLAPENPDMTLASELARRGWVDLATDLCARFEKQPGASVVIAEVSSARARLEPDPARAAAELDGAIARLGAAPTPDERMMAGYLRTQRARLPGDQAKAWVEAERYYRESVEVLSKQTSTPAVDEALLDARLELPKTLAGRARSLAETDPARKKLLDEAAKLFVEFQFDGGSRPIVFEAILEEGRVRADLKDHVRAERCFRGVLKLKKPGAPMPEYTAALWDSAFLALLRTQVAGGKGAEAVTTADGWLREHPGQNRTSMSLAVQLTKAEGLAATGEKGKGIAVATGVAAADPNGPAGVAARDRIREWTAAGGATAQQMMLIADGLLDREMWREALVDLRRCVELCRDAAERGKYEPVASFKRGDCFRALKQEVEASLAYQDVFRKYPAHELAPRAAFEAVRSLMRSAAASRDRRDEDQQEMLLAEIKKLGVGGVYESYFRFIEAETLERKGQWKAAADLYAAVEESCEVHDDALVSAGHCYRRSVDAKGPVKDLQTAEALLRRAVSRLEKAQSPRLLVVAYYELATISLHDSVARPKDALDFVGRCAKLLPAESEMLPRLGEMEIRARLAGGDLETASAKLDALLKSAPDSSATIRSARRLAAHLEAGDPARAARYYRVWLDATGVEAPTAADVRAGADGLYRVARAVSKFDESVVSVLDLRERPLPDPAVWRDAARAQSRLLGLLPPGAKDRSVIEARLAWCLGFSADWAESKRHAESLFQKYKLLGADGVQPAVLDKERWLAGLYLDYGQTLFQLAKAGQKFQYANALTVCTRMSTLTAKNSEPWWVGRALYFRILYERGEGNDLNVAAASLSSLLRDYPQFDENRHGMKALMTDLKDRIQQHR